MTNHCQNEAEPKQYIDRNHEKYAYVFITFSLSLCITVDILQYSMPLAFLPSVLEDRGHSPMKIATAIGIYYWTGFLGGFCLTTYQVWRLFYEKEESDVDITPFSTVVRHIKFLVFGLGIGVITLFIQALDPRWATHTACRFIQGFVGAFIFFYVFLLSVAIFKGQQQVTAMTFASCATVLAELAGPLLGSILFDHYGQRSVFWFLGGASIINQLLLVAAIYMLKSTEETGTPIIRSIEPAAASDEPNTHWYAFLMPQPGSVTKMKNLLQSRTFVCSCLLITMAGVIKGSVEEMLPFHADHQWGYDPTEIGTLFCTVAVTYLLASFLVCRYWIAIGRFQVAMSAQALVMLGVTAWMGFCVAYYYRDAKVLYGTFAAYGFAAGLAFTAAAQLIAEAVDAEEGHGKEAANGIWNTMWEFGGSTGFFLGGFVAHHHADQMSLTGRYAVCAAVVAVCMAAVGYGSNGGSHLVEKKLGDKVDKMAEYGSTA